MAANCIRLAVGQRLLRLRPLIGPATTAVPEQPCPALPSTVSDVRSWPFTSQIDVRFHVSNAGQSGSIASETNWTLLTQQGVMASWEAMRMSIKRKEITGYGHGS